MKSEELNDSNLFADRLEEEGVVRIVLVTGCCSKTRQQLGNAGSTGWSTRHFTHQAQATDTPHIL